MSDEKSSGEIVAAPPKSQKGPWIAVILVTVLCNAAWGAVFVMAKPDAPADPKAVAEAPEEGEDGKPGAKGSADEPGPLVGLDPFVVNLNDPVNTRYLRIGISLEIGSEAERDGVSKRLVPLRDEFIRHLSSQEPTQLLSRNDKDKLREALLAKAQSVVPNKSVRQIYFTEFMMQ